MQYNFYIKRSFWQPYESEVGECQIARGRETYIYVSSSGRK